MNLIEKFLSVVAPHQCVGCCSEGNILCQWCAANLSDLVPSRCFLCRSITDDSATCKKCRKVTKLRNAWVACPYEGLAEQLIKSLKYERAAAAAKPISQLIIDSMPYIEPDVIISHVPTANSRVRQRGYDQAKLIAKEVSKASGLKYEPVLLRVGKQRQVGSTRLERKQQLEGAFIINPRSNPKGKKYLLVDDVVTTGSSLIEAASVLKGGGVKSVSAAVFAQAI